MKHITIYDLLPLLKKGWVACNSNGSWRWFKYKPKCSGCDEDCAGWKAKEYLERYGVK